ncbi:MAG TPA: hypothetical protein EYQ18_06160 [Candidatus Handelsmanbacteria bacterium]|nr:hypothetical protein [Candidatus Handelsmanbacteria bacterium]
MRALIHIIAFALCALTVDVWAASVAVRQTGGQSEFTAELGQIVDLEVFVDAGTEELAGFSLYLSYDSAVFRLVPAAFDKAGQPLPFATTNFLEGIPLVNAVEELGGETILSYTEAAGGVSRNTATGQGVAVRFQLEVVRRTLGETTSIRIEERGHNRASHYVRADLPGIEQRFSEPLGEAEVRVTGFRISPRLPDLTIIEGERLEVFDLDNFVDTVGTSVLWTHSRLSEIETTIDVETNQVTMLAQAGLVGEWKMIFTALELNEGLTASDTIYVLILSRPKISDFPDTLRFAEDTINEDLDLDAFVADIDHALDKLLWTASEGDDVLAAVAEASHVVKLTATPDFFGSEVVSFIVDDPTGLADTVVTVVEVFPVNDPPESIEVSPVYPAEGARVSVPLTDFFSDRDDDVSSMQVFLEVEGGVSAEIIDGQLVVSGQAAGRGIVRLTAQDTSGAVAQTRQVAVVLGPGESVGPEIQPLAEQRVLGGQAVELTLAELAVDDSSAVALLWEAVPDSGLSAIVQDGQLLISGASGFSGSSKVQLRVTDPEGNQDQVDLKVSVLGPDDAKGPQIFAPGVIGLRPGEERIVALDEIVADPDDPDANIIWDIFPSSGLNAVFDSGTRQLTLSAGENFVKPASLGLVASDPSGERASAEIPVLFAAPGDPPQVADFNSVSLDSLKAETRLDLDLFAFDDLDKKSEIVWEVESEPGIIAALDMVTHELKLSRDPDAIDPPTATQVLLRARDTDGQETTALITVGLPPLFSLQPLPDVELFPGQIDSSIVLSDYAVGAAGGLAPALVWRVVPSTAVNVILDPQSTRVLIGVADPTFFGSEIVEFTATDESGRERLQRLRVILKGAGLSPQIRVLPRLQLELGQVDESVDLDDFVVDDDVDDQLNWSASGQRLMTVDIAAETRVVTLTAGDLETGVDQIQFLVRDPAGNTALGVMEVIVVQGGSAPEIGALPKILIEAGSEESQVALSPFAADIDTPAEELNWEVLAEPGISARIEGDQLFVSVPAGEAGIRVLHLTVEDPQGNQTSAEMEVLIQQDEVPPEFTLSVGRHPVFSELLELRIAASEQLREDPEVEVDDELQEVERLDDGTYRVNFLHPPGNQEERMADIEVTGFDPGGNEGQRVLIVALKWMDEMGGNVRSPDPQLMLNVTDAAAGPGQMAVLYQLGEAETPPGNEGQPVYSVDLLRGRKLDHPVTLNFFPGANEDPALGILRWDELGGVWEEIPTQVDPVTDWLAATVGELGLFRLGRVEPENRQAAMKLGSYPNPFSPSRVPTAKIVYQIDSPGKVQLQLFNSLGHRVRTLVDEFQEVGVWTAAWNGRDAEGTSLSSGMYFYQLQEGGRRHHRALILVR